MSRITMLLTGLVVASLSPAAAAELKVGDKAPEISARDWLNAKGRVSLAALEGKIVIAEFWATWCGPCMQSIPHLVEMHHKWKDKHVVIIGMTGESKAAILPTVKRLKMSYIVGAGSDTSKRYGVRGIPHAFIITPDGTIAWRGHPMNRMEQALEEIYKKHPPTGLSRKDLERIEEVLAAAKKDLDAGKHASAGRALRQVTDKLPASHELRKTVDELTKKLETAAAEALARADKLRADRKLPEALAGYRGVIVEFEGTAAADKATAALADMKKDPAVAKAVKAAEDDMAAQRLFNDGESAVKAEKYARALAAYEAAAKYADTAWGRKAAEKVQAIKADAKLYNQIRDAKAERKCPGWLTMARSYVKMGKPEKAKGYYQKIVETYPDSSYAQTAREELARLTAE